MLLKQRKKKGKKIITTEAVGKYQVGASLTASRCHQANQNAFSYFSFIRNTGWIDKVLFRHFEDFYHYVFDTRWQPQNHFKARKSPDHEYELPCTYKLWNPQLNLTICVLALEVVVVSCNRKYMHTIAGFICNFPWKLQHWFQIIWKACAKHK